MAALEESGAAFLVKQMNEVYGVDIRILDDKEVFDSWYQKMPEYRKDKIDRIGPFNDTKLSLGAGIALHRALLANGNGWMASPTQWTWVWVDFGSW